MADDITYSSVRSGSKKKRDDTKVKKEIPFIEGLSNMEVYEELDQKREELKKLIEEQGK